VKWLKKCGKKIPGFYSPAPQKSESCFDFCIRRKILSRLFYTKETDSQIICLFFKNTLRDKMRDKF